MTAVRKLDALSAEVKTATVEVKALTISGRQVTLSVFRQLPIREIVSLDTVDLQGIPWGHVNYHPQCEVSGEHLHIVWQAGDELYRSSTTKCAPDVYQDETLTRERAFVNLMIRAYWLQHQTEKRRGSLLTGGPSLLDQAYTFGGRVLRYRHISRAYAHNEWERMRSGIPAVPSRKEESSLEQLEADVQRVTSEWDKSLNDEAAFREKWKKTYSTLTRLQQLYIAV